MQRKTESRHQKSKKCTGPSYHYVPADTLGHPEQIT